MIKGIKKRPIPTGRETAANSYDRLLTEARRRIGLIEVGLRAHAKRFDGTNYGYVGDLSEVNKHLGRALQSLGVDGFTEK